MKALLLKDFYMMQTSGRTNVLMIGLFLFFAVIAKQKQTMFFLSFAVLLASMMPLTFLSIDEKDRWMDYSRALPYSENDVVCSTYLFNLSMTIALTLISIGIFCLKSMNNPAELNTANFLTLALSLLIMGLMPAILIYPVIFWLGSEKGRIVYMALMALIYVFFFVMMNNVSILNWAFINQPIEIIAAGTFMLLYGGAWILSIYLYGRRLKKA